MSLDVTLIPILEDNYTYILKSDDQIAVLDPGESQPVIDYLEQHNLTPDYIFITHHHWDHTDGNHDIAQKYGAKIVAPAAEDSKIKNIDIALQDGTNFDFGDTSFQSIETKGHTQGHLCFWFDQDKVLFAGDMIFGMGCGRPIEGNAQDLYESCQKLSFLPDETTLYCGHEYTQTNGRFALSIKPDDAEILKRMNEVNKMRDNNIPTIPTSMKLERETNLFVRAKDLEEFQKLRDARNNF